MKTWILMHIIGVLYLGSLQFPQIRESFRLLFSFKDPFTHHAFSEGINLFERLRKTGPTPGGLTSGPWFTAFKTEALSRGEGRVCSDLQRFYFEYFKRLDRRVRVHKMADFNLSPNSRPMGIFHQKRFLGLLSVDIILFRIHSTSSWPKNNQQMK